MKLYLSIALILLSRAILAQLSYFTSVGSEAGLTQGFVYSINTGPEGYLWLGASNGFYKFNGSQVSSTVDHGLPKQPASTSLLSSQGILWLGFFDGTIAQINKQDTAIIFKDLFSEKISAIVEADYGAIFFIGQQGSIGRFHNGNMYILPPPNPGLFFYDAVHFSKNEFLIAAEQGLLSVEFNQDTYEFNVLLEDVIFSLYKQGGYLYTGTRNGLIKIGKDKKVITSINLGATVNDLLVDKNNTLWAATNGKGLIQFYEINNLDNYATFQVTNGLPSNFLISLGLDREGNLWTGTAGEGLAMFVSDAFIYQLPDIVQKGINTIKSDGNNLWVGTNHGLFNWNKGELKKYLEEEVITALHIDKKGNTWAGVQRMGLKLKTQKAQNFEIIQPSNWPSINLINSVDEDKYGNIWVATKLNGLLKLNSSLSSFEQFDIGNQLPHNNIFQAICDQNNRVWLASSDEGVGYLYKEKFHKILLNESLNKYTVNCLYESNDGSIWIGSNGAGLFKFTNDSLQQFLSTGGLLSPYVNMLGIDNQNNLWIGTSKGINILDEDTDSFQSYSTDIENWKSFKIRSNTFAASNKNVWLQTDEGLLQFDRKKLPKFSTPPLIRLKNAELDGASIDKQKKISLPYGDYRLKLAFEAIAFRDNQYLAYKYRLTGFENDWSDYEYRNYAEYPKISAGEYSLSLQVKSENGLESEVTEVLHVSIAIPFWKQTWFYISVLLVLGIIAYSTHQFRLKRLQKANRILGEKVTEKTKALAQEKEKLETAYKKLVQLESFKESMNSMIVHDLKNPLNLVIALSDEKSQVYEAGRQMLQMVLNILDVSRFEEAKVALTLQNIKVATLVQHATEQVSILLQQKQIKIENDFKVGLTVEVDADIITRVMVNLLSNAIKYSPAGSKITIIAIQQSKKVLLKIKDTGFGIPSEELPYIFDKFMQVDSRSDRTMRSSGLGLTFCKLAVEAHGGNIEVESVEGKGSTFSFALNGQEMQLTAHEILQTQDIQTEESIDLTNKDLEALTPYLLKFKDLEVFDTSTNMQIIDEIPDSTANIKVWKDAMSQAIIAFNESEYNSLITQLHQTKKI